METTTTTKAQEQLEYEHELSLETAARLEDLAMALCHYDHEIAKRALSFAIGTLTAYYPEPCLHISFDVAEAQMDFVIEHIGKEHAEHEQTNETNIDTTSQKN